MKRYLVFALSAFLLLTTACKSNVDKVVNWYHDTGPDIERSLPSVTECDRRESSYWILVRELRTLSDQFMQQQVQMAGYASPEATQASARVFSETVDSLYQAFLTRSGWTEDQSKFCEGRYNAERKSAEACEEYVSFPVDLMGKSTWHYGVVGYCVEYSIPPFD